MAGGNQEFDGTRHLVIAPLFLPHHLFYGHYHDLPGDQDDEASQDHPRQCHD